MIGATILLCYLFTCCTHLTQLTLAAQDTHHNNPISGQSADTSKLEELATGSSKSDGEPRRSSDQSEQLKHHNVHKLMSEQDLRRTFQVDSHDQVPEYEILQLTVNDDGSHLISPISDLGELSATRATNHRTHTDNNDQINYNHSTRKTSAAPKEEDEAEEEDEEEGAKIRATRHQQSASKVEGKQRTRRKADDDVKLIGGVNYKRERDGESRDNQEDAKVVEARRLRECNPKAGDSSGENYLAEEEEGEKMNEIVMKLSTFGKDFKLRLKRNVDFQQRIKDMKMFMAESTKDGQLRYTEIKSHQAQQQQQQQQPNQQQNSNEDKNEKKQSEHQVSG